MMPHGRRCPESGLCRNLIDAEGRGFKEIPRPLYSRIRKPVGRCHAGTGVESTDKGPFTHCRPIRHVGNRNLPIKLLEKALEYSRQRSTFAPIDRAFEKLRLATLSMRRYDQPASNVVGDVGSKIAPNEVKAKIEPRRTTGRR
jgi:hypothetical protein